MDYTNHIRDVAYTAAFMMGLDLIVSVDEAGAHLAGALSREASVYATFSREFSSSSRRRSK